MINELLIKLTEVDKRMIYILLGAFILLFVIIGYIGYIVTRIMKWQGKKINNYVTDVVITGVITKEDEFVRYARRKNVLVFYHQARIPALIVLLSILFYVISSSIIGFSNPWDYKTGFATLLYVWDLTTIITTAGEGGAGLLVNWPVVLNTPHFVPEAWISYIFVPLFVSSGCWYLFVVQGFIARFLQIKKLGQKVFGDRIENFTAGVINAKQPAPEKQEVVEDKNE